MLDRPGNLCYTETVLHNKGGAMANLTITLNDDVLKKARIRALQEGVSVNALLRNYLNGYAGVQEEQLLALEQLLTLSKASKSKRGRAKWTRAGLYER